MTGARRNARRGSALLAVMWFSAALTAIAFTLSMSVRTELDRAALNVEATRAYFLAQGAIEATLMRMATPVMVAGGAPGYEQEQGARFFPGMRRMRFVFPEGEIEVEVIGEQGKVNINSANAEMLAELLMASRMDPAVSFDLAARIASVRTRGPSARGNFPAESSFLAPGASFQQLEELLLVPGVTPDVLYGSFRRDQEGNLVRHGGLYGLLTVHGGGAVDMNYASPRLLRAAGLPEGAIDAIVSSRVAGPLRSGDPAVPGLDARRGGIPLGLGGDAGAYTLWATATLNNGRAKRSVGALVRSGPSASRFPINVARWYDNIF